MPPSFFAVGQRHLQILSEICCHWAAVDHDAPWRASLVCRLWRAAVLSTPKGWSRVDVCFPDEIGSRKRTKRPKVPWEEDTESDDESDNDEDEGNEEYTDWRPRPLALWLSRARGTELFVTLKINRAPRVDFIYPAIQALLLHYSKIKELDVVVDSPIFPMDQVLSMLLKPAPALEHLTLSLNIKQQPIGNMDDGIVTGFWEFLKGTPRLRSLTLSRCLLGPMPLVPMPGRQNHLALRTLTLDNTHGFWLRSTLRMLQPFICLETLTLTSTNGRAGISTGVTVPLTLPTLTTFTVGNDIQILASLTLPNLRTLIFDKKLSNEGQGNFVALLSDLFERGTNLQSLTLSDALILDKEFSQILEYIPGLVALELWRCSVQIQSLIRTTKDITPLCPQLDTIRLSSSDLGGTIVGDGRALLELVVARNKQPGRYRPITTMGILKCRYIDDQAAEKIRKAGGRVLTLEYVEYTPED